MTRYPDLREIAVLPTLPPGLTVEDFRLEPVGPCFDLQHALPNAAFAAMLAVLNVSKPHYLALVRARRGVDLLSAEPDGGDGAFRHRGEYAARWRALEVPHLPGVPALLDDDTLVEIIENASYGGQLAAAGYIDRKTMLPAGASAVRLAGRFQLGIIDYIWGSGHTVTFDGVLTLDLSGGRVIEAPGYAYDGVCGFVVSYFRFAEIEAACLPAGWRFEALRRPSNSAT